MKFFLVLAAAMTLGSAVSLAADDTAAAAPAKGACKADIQKFCASVPHEKGQVRSCLTEHSADLSDACKQRMAAHAAKTN